MPSRRAIKPLLSPGAYDAPGRPASTAQARRLFLTCVARCVPAVLEDLRRSGVADLGAWAGRWHLSDPWVLDAARATIERWQARPSSRLRWNLDGVESLPEPVAEHDTTRWRLPTPDAQTEDVRGYLARVRIQAEERWTAHVRALRAQGFGPGVRLDAPHLVWLVRYQIEGADYASIARDVASVAAIHRSNIRNTVRTAVVSMARAIGLSLRAASKGRRRQPS
jgi:hypothetical protein